MSGNARIGSSLDDFLAEEGVLEAFEAQPIQEVIAWQLGKAVEEQSAHDQREGEGTQ